MPLLHCCTTGVSTLPRLRPHVELLFRADAKILEQHPDKQISWISEDGKKTRGTVTFEPIGESRTFVRVSMSYRAEGPGEAIGSAAGLDARRVRGDLERFKELIESRGTESGAWRGEVSEGTPAK